MKGFLSGFLNDADNFGELLFMRFCRNVGFSLSRV
jgi:hypothetical protein